MRTWALLFGLAACNQVLGVHDFAAADAALDGKQDGGSLLVECSVQRVVHLVAGNGGFAWFTIAWPVPAVIESFSTTYAYDDPTLAMNVGTELAHPLYARRLNQRSIWLGLGTHPEPSVFVAGSAEAHSTSPVTTTQSHGVTIDAMAASLQGSLAPMYPAIVIGGLAFGSAPNAPSPVVITSAASAPALFTASTQDQVRPTPQQLARYLPNGGNMAETELATGLAFTANAFKLGLVTTVMMPAFQDDPHGAFGSPGVVTTRGNNLASMVDAFYADLQASVETTCGHAGHPLALADNVVFIVSGDTPKNPFVATNWPDGPPGNANLLYVRGNGFTRPGWFGALDPNTRTNFDPNTGALSSAVANDTSTAAAWAGMLYAVARGDRGVVTAITTAPYDGVIATP